MNEISSPTGLAAAAAPNAHFSANIKWFSGMVLLVVFMALQGAHARSADDQYLQVYGIIEQADGLVAKGQAGDALARYREAQVALQRFQKTNPDWNAKMVSYRFKYLAEKVAALSEKPVAPADAGPAAGTREAPPAAKAPPSATASDVKLLNPGAEPRKVLRLHPKPGDKQVVSTIMKIAIDMTMGEMPGQSIKTPAIKMTSEMTVKTVSADGDITYEMVLNDASVTDEPGIMPQVAEALKSALAKIKGLSGTGAMSDRGRSKGLDMKAPPDADPQTQQIMDQMKEAFTAAVTPLPEEAIGSGAKWEAKIPIKSQGITIDQTAAYQMASIEGDRLVVKSIIAQRASNQKMQIPAMPSLKLDLAKMVGKGAGEAIVELAQLLPSAGSVNIHSEFSLGMNMGGQTQAVTLKMDVSLQTEAK